MSLPAKSSDLNPLDLYICRGCRVEVTEETFELKMIVEKYASQISRDTLIRVADNFLDRVKIFIFSLREIVPTPPPPPLATCAYKQTKPRRVSMKANLI